MAHTRTRTIVVDGRRAQGIRTGVGRYTKSLLDNWPDKNTIVLQSSHQQEEPITQKTLRLSKGIVWHLQALLVALRYNALYFSPESLLVPIALGRRAVLVVHDLTPLDKPSLHKRRNVVVHRLALRLAVRRAGKIIVPTEAVRTDLIRWFPKAIDRLHTVHEGIRSLHHAEEDNKFLAKRPYALYVGTIEPRKNVPQLVEAFNECAPADWSLILAGKSGWLSEEEDQRLETLCASERVHRLGFVSDDVIDSLYSNASLFMYVSSSEGFGLPVAEALGYGITVIHTDDPALLEVSQGAGIVVCRSDLATSLRAALDKFFGLDTNDLSRMSQRGRAIARKYDWQRTAASTLQLIRGHA